MVISVKTIEAELQNNLHKKIEEIEAAIDKHLKNAYVNLNSVIFVDLNQTMDIKNMIATKYRKEGWHVEVKVNGLEFSIPRLIETSPRTSHSSCYRG